MKELTVDKEHLGETEACRRHVAMAEFSAATLFAQKDFPTPESSMELAQFSSSMPRDNFRRTVSASPANADLAAASIPECARPVQFGERAAPPSPRLLRERQLPPQLPQLPQLWMSQPRSMTPKSPFAGSTGRSASVASMMGSRIVDDLRAQSSQPPLRRVDSEPGIYCTHDPDFRRRGYIDPRLQLRPSASNLSGSASNLSGTETGRSAADRYGTTFIFG